MMISGIYYSEQQLFIFKIDKTVSSKMDGIKVKVRDDLTKGSQII